MVAVASRAALMGEETHDAWVDVFLAVTAPPADPGRAPCPNCGHFAIDFRYLADAHSRVGLCALWCSYCGHGHVLSRVQVPEGVAFVPLDAPDEVLKGAIPTFYDAAAHESELMDDLDSSVAARMAALRPYAAEYELLNLTRIGSQRARDLLSPREREVIGLLSEGRTVAQIAGSLQISPTTVRTHIQRVYWKLGRAAGRRMLEP